MGISRRISAIPRGFKLGEHYVLLAHPKIKEIVDPRTGDVDWIGGRVSNLQADVAREDHHGQPIELAGITAVIVPNNDSDHRGTV